MPSYFNPAIRESNRLLSLLVDAASISPYKLYIWSIVIEMVMYLTFDLNIIYITNVKLSRLIQFLFIALFVLDYLKNPSKYNHNIVLNKNILIFLSVIFISTCSYAFLGGYNHAAELFQLKNSVSYEEALFKAYKLPIREFSVYLYVIFYYLILSQIFIKSDKHIVYFLKIFERVFLLAVFLGIIALIFSLFEIQLFSRQFNYGQRAYIGVRFHGIFGEPRDAAISLIFALAIFNLKSIYIGNEKQHYRYLLFILFLLAATKSGSLAIAVILFIPLFILFNDNRLKLIKIKPLLLFLLFVIIFILYIKYNPRLLLYYHEALLIPELIETETLLPYHIKNQIVNIYPFYLTYNKIINLDILSLIFGSGLGVNAIEKYPHGPYEFGTAHAQIPRLILETGIAGFLSWCFMLFHYVCKYKYILNSYQWRILFFYFVLLCSSALAHRSHLIYIYIGFAFSVYNVLLRRAVLKNG